MLGSVYETATVERGMGGLTAHLLVSRVNRSNRSEWISSIYSCHDRDASESVASTELGLS